MQQKKSPFSEFLKDKMRDANVKAEELAERLGYKQTFYVARWLKAEGLPALQQLETLSRALNASPGETLVVWVMTQDYDLAMSLKSEVVRKMPAARRRAAIRKVLADPSRAMGLFDPIDEGEPGDDV